MALRFSYQWRYRSVCTVWYKIPVFPRVHRSPTDTLKSLIRMPGSTLESLSLIEMSCCQILSAVGLMHCFTWIWSGCCHLHWHMKVFCWIWKWAQLRKSTFWCATGKQKHTGLCTGADLIRDEEADSKDWSALHSFICVFLSALTVGLNGHTCYWLSFVWFCLKLPFT